MYYSFLWYSWVCSLCENSPSYSLVICFLCVSYFNIKITLKICRDFKVSLFVYAQVPLPTIYITPCLSLFKNRGLKNAQCEAMSTVTTFIIWSLDTRSFFYDRWKSRNSNGTRNQDVFSYLCLQEDYLSTTKEQLENGEDVRMCLCCSLIVKVKYIKDQFICG